MIHTENNTNNESDDETDSDSPIEITEQARYGFNTAKIMSGIFII